MTRLSPEPRHWTLALAFVAASVQAQEGAAVKSGFVPRMAVSQSWTDNLRLTEHDKDAALITTFSPGISVVRSVGAIQGSLDYSLSGVAYVKSDVPSRLQNALRANGQIEIIPRTLFVDAQASIGQQNVSALGLQAATTPGAQGSVSLLDNSNRRETGALTVTPRLLGQLGGLASFELRGNASITEVRGSSFGDSRDTGADLKIGSSNPGTLAWYLQLQTRQTRPKEAHANRNSSVIVGLNYRPNPDWVFGANVGEERSDYATGTSGANYSTTGGLTADWSPSPRTHLNGTWQHHSYGSSHGFSLDHRMRTSVWRVTDMRSVTLGNTGAGGGVRTNYDLFFQLYASVEPDPVKRDVLVRGQLAALGLSPDAQAATGFLSAGPSQLRTQMLSFTLQGVRTNITASITRTLTSRLGNNVNVGGDLASNAAVEQRSYSLSGSYQLSPISGLAITASRQQSSGDLSGQHTQFTSLMANWNGRLGSRLNLQLGARHSSFEGATTYTENAVFATLTQQF